MAKREERAVFEALTKFSDGVTSKMTSLTAGEPEDQLRGPFETFMQEVGKAICRPIVCTGEVRRVALVCLSASVGRDCAFIL